MQYDVSMNRLSSTDRARILSCLVEGNSLRSTERMCGVSINTVTKLLIDAGTVASADLDEKMVNLPCKRIQCDEIWSFIGAKDKTIERGAKRGQEVNGSGSIWTWTALCAETKVVPSFMVGSRDASAACKFMDDLASRLRHRVQLTTDGHAAYLSAVEGAFGLDVDYAMLVKHYGPSPDMSAPERRYSPSECTGTEIRRVTGGPDEKHVSTSYVERLNLTTRMHVRRFTRLTNAFSKKAENHAHAVALHFWHYNFARVHKTLRVTPAMAAGVTDRVLGLGDLVDLMTVREETATDVSDRRKDRRDR